MQVLKFILLILTFICSTYLGLLISKLYSKRTEELKQIKTAIDMLEAKIKFTYEPLLQIFEEISTTLNNNIGNIFLNASKSMKNKSVKDSWIKAIDTTELGINKEDKKILKNLGNMLRKNRYRRTSEPNRDN